MYRQYLLVCRTLHCQIQLNIKNKMGDTPLMLAVSKGQVTQESPWTPDPLSTTTTGRLCREVAGSWSRT